jgi:hypothetical protein
VAYACSVNFRTFQDDKSSLSSGSINEMAESEIPSKDAELELQNPMTNGNGLVSLSADYTSAMDVNEDNSDTIQQSVPTPAVTTDDDLTLTTVSI